LLKFCCVEKYFNDKNEQHRILGANVEDYLEQKYKFEAEYVIVLLSNSYSKKIWTKFESEQFKHRFGENAVIPIRYSDTTIGFFDETGKHGGITYNVNEDLKTQAADIVEILAKKMTERK